MSTFIVSRLVRQLSGRGALANVEAVLDAGSRLRMPWKEDLGKRSRGAIS